MGGKLLNDIKSINVNSLACVRVEGGESECFRINSGVRQVCSVPLWTSSGEWWNEKVEATLERKEGAWKEVLGGARHEIVKEEHANF